MNCRCGFGRTAAVGVAIATGITRGVSAQQSPLPMPLPAGSTLVQTLAFQHGDRESVHTLVSRTAEGIEWSWWLVEVHSNGDTLRGLHEYVERSADLADAFRLWGFHRTGEKGVHPGYTMHALSRAVYRRLRAAGTDSLQVMNMETPPGSEALAAVIGSARGVPVRWRGTITLATPAPVSFPLLVNDRRVTVPALHLRGRMVARGNTWEPEIWVLADSTYPLLLKWIRAFPRTENVLQTTRVDLPSGNELTGPEIERKLLTTCRVELPGIYFDFNSAVLSTASDRAIGSLAELLTRHPDWMATLEGHTDSIGTAGANLNLSRRRVEAVRTRLVNAHKIDGTRLKTVGYGSSRPREPNTTIEGRARNRRVELVRACAGQ